MSNAYEFKGLAHIGIPTVDIKTSVDFYRNILGFQVVTSDVLNLGDTKVQIIIIQQGNCIIELVERSDVKKLDNPAIHFALEVKGIDNGVRDLTAKGIVFETAKATAKPVFGGIKNIFFTGPNRERIELIEMGQ